MVLNEKFWIWHSSYFGKDFKHVDWKFGFTLQKIWTCCCLMPAKWCQKSDVESSQLEHWMIGQCQSDCMQFDTPAEARADAWFSLILGWCNILSVEVPISLTPSLHSSDVNRMRYFMQKTFLSFKCKRLCENKKKHWGIWMEDETFWYCQVQPKAHKKAQSKIQVVLSSQVPNLSLSALIDLSHTNLQTSKHLVAMNSVVNGFVPKQI